MDQDILEEKILVDKSVLKEWKEWARKGDMRVKGYRIIEAPRGDRIDRIKRARFMVVERPHGVVYQHSFGLISKFYEGIVEGKLYGTKCPKCGLVYLPPRAHCWNPECKLQETEWIEMPLEGVVVTYTIMAFAATPFLSELPFILAYVKVGDSVTALPIQLKEIDPVDVHIGLKVKIKFKENRVGDLMDLYAVPAEKPHPPPRSKEEIEWLKSELARVEEWVRKRFPEKFKK